MIISFRKVVKKQEIREIKNFQKNQHALQLRARAEAVEVNLQEDRKRIGTNILNFHGEFD